MIVHQLKYIQNCPHITAGTVDELKLPRKGKDAMNNIIREKSLSQFQKHSLHAHTVTHVSQYKSLTRTQRAEDYLSRQLVNWKTRDSG